jgi:hypothetical protein
MQNPTFESNLQAALFWSGYGFRVIPIVPGQKKPAVFYNPWLDDLSVDHIKQHWRQHPNHEVGAVLGEDVIMLDADTGQAEAALAEVEHEHGLTPSLIVATPRGSHHYFQLEQGSYAKPDSHDTYKYPDRIDVRAYRNSVVLPSLPPRRVRRFLASKLGRLTVATQRFVDAIAVHNGRQPPRPRKEIDAQDSVLVGIGAHALPVLLQHLDPDAGYEDWLHVLMAIYHATGGSVGGLELAVSWSSKGTKYQGRSEIEGKWRSFSPNTANPITIATLIAMARSAGADIAEIMTEPFEACEFSVVEPRDTAGLGQGADDHPLARFSLRGQYEELAKNAKATKPLLGDVSLSGQSTIFYAAPNTGKTLIILWLLRKAILCGRVDPMHVYYLKFDDS